MSDVDLSQLSDEDLKALDSGDLSKVSDAGLAVMHAAHQNGQLPAELPGESPDNRGGYTHESPFRVEISGTGDKPAAPTPDYTAGRNANASLQGLYSAINGPLMGFGDELAGGIGGAYDTAFKGGSFSDNYKANRDYVRGAQDSYKDEYPWTSGITQTMAAAPLAMYMPLEKGIAAMVPRLAPYITPAATAASEVIGTVGKAVRTGLSGGINGTVYGAGNSTADTAGGVATDALRDGMVSAGLGAGISPVAQGIGAVGSNIAQRASTSAAANAADLKVAEALARDAQGATFKSGAANPVDQAAARLRSLGPEATLADSAGKNTRDLLDTLSTLPGATKNDAQAVIRNRQATSANRLIDGADNALGTGGQRLAPTIEDLIAQRKAASDPEYALLRQHVIAAPSPTLVDTVAAADKLGATGLAKKMATAGKVPYTLDTSNPANWSAGDIDLVKRGLGDMITNETNPVTGKVTSLGGSYKKLQDDLVSELNTATTDPKTGVSQYARARAAFAGPSELIDAANAGRAAMSMDPAAIARTTAGMSAQEAQAFRVGASEALRAQLGNSSGGRTAVMNVWQNPGMEDKLRSTFGGDRAYRQFVTTAAKEDALKKLSGFVGGGSQTAGRLAGMSDMDNEALQEVGNSVLAAHAGHAPGAITSAYRAVKAGVQMPESVRDAMGATLLSKGADAAGALTRARGVVQQVNNGRSIRAGATGALLGNGQNTIGTDGIIGSALYGNK